MIPHSPEPARPGHCDRHAFLGPRARPSADQDARVRDAEQWPSRGPYEDRQPRTCVRFPEQGDVVRSEGLSFRFELFRQSVYSRLAGYEDTNDAARRAEDPTFRMRASRERRETSVVLSSTLHWLDTEVLAEQNSPRLSRGNAALMQRDSPGTRLCSHWFRANEVRVVVGGKLLLRLSTP